MSSEASLFSRFHERTGARIPSLLMVGVCAAIALVSARLRQRNFVASAVTAGSSVVLTAHSNAVVEAVLVLSGQRVRAGKQLVRLSSPELLAEKAELEARIRRVMRESELARLELTHGFSRERRDDLLALSKAQVELDRTLADTQRRAREAESAGQLSEEAKHLLVDGLIAPLRAHEEAARHLEKASIEGASAASLAAERRRLETLRRELASDGETARLAVATADMHLAELDVLSAKKALLDVRLNELTLLAPVDGVVMALVSRGSAVAPGTELARVVAAHASEVAAYVPPSETPPSAERAVAFAVVLADGRRCAGRNVLRSEGAAIEKPPQLVRFGQADSWGFPVRVALPEGCRLPIGQVVELSLEVP